VIKVTKEIEAILCERFGMDQVISLATSSDNIPHARSVNAYYENGSFYVLTYGLSRKMMQIRDNPVVAISGDWFTAHGKGVDMGWFGKTENAAIAQKMRQVFSAWIDNGHNNFEDVNTCILRIDLTDGILYDHGKRYDICFKNA